MADVSGPTIHSGMDSLSDEDNPLTNRRNRGDDARFDMTAMVDLVFMMNIYFLVTTVGAALAEIDLPAARHCVPADPTMSVVVSIVDGGGEGCLVYLGEGREGAPLVGMEEQDEAVREAVLEGAGDNKDTLLIKAEKSIKLRDVRRIAGAAGAREGMDLKLAVMEKD